MNILNLPALRLAAIVLMTLTHLRLNNQFQFHTLPQELTAERLIRIFLDDGMGRISASLLGIVSGYLAYTTVMRSGIAYFVTSRSKSLLIPYFLWSLIFLIFFALWSGQSFAEFLRDLGSSRFFGLVYPLGNGPLHYLHDLFICGVFCALLVWLASTVRLDRKFWPLLFMVLACIGTIVLTATDLKGAPPGLNDTSVLPRADLFFFFLLGFALSCWEVEFPSQYETAVKTLAPYSLLIVLASVALFVPTALSWRFLMSLGEETGSYATAGVGLVFLFVSRLAGSVVAYVSISALCRRFGAVPRRAQRIAFRLFVSHEIALVIFFDVFAPYAREDLVVYLTAWFTLAACVVAVTFFLEFIANATITSVRMRSRLSSP